MSDTTKFKKFDQTNSTHDLARWLLSIPEAQVERIKLMMEDGATMDMDARKHKRFVALKKMLKLKKANT